MLRRQTAVEDVVAQHDATRRKQSVLHDESVASSVHWLVQIHEDEIGLCSFRSLLLQESLDLSLDYVDILRKMFPRKLHQALLAFHGRDLHVLRENSGRHARQGSQVPRNLAILHPGEEIERLRAL